MPWHTATILFNLTKMGHSQEHPYIPISLRILEVNTFNNTLFLPYPSGHKKFPQLRELGGRGEGGSVDLFWNKPGRYKSQIRSLVGLDPT